MCCNVLQCEEASKAGGEHEKVSVLLCVVVCCSLRRPSKQVESVKRSVCCSALQCSSVLQFEEASKAGGEREKVSVLQCVAACCSVLQCVAVICSEVQRVAVCHTVRRSPKKASSREGSVMQCVAV